MGDAITRMTDEELVIAVRNEEIRCLEIKLDTLRDNLIESEENNECLSEQLTERKVMDEYLVHLEGTIKYLITKKDV